MSLRRVDRRLLPWQSPSNSRTRNVIHRRGAHLERPAEKFLIFRFLSAKRFHLADILYEIGTFPRALKMSAPTRYDEKQTGIRWRFPHQRARWFGMTVLFGARTYPCKFPICRGAEENRKARKLISRISYLISKNALPVHSGRAFQTVEKPVIANQSSDWCGNLPVKRYTASYTMEIPTKVVRYFLGMTAFLLCSFTLVRQPLFTADSV